MTHSKKSVLWLVIWLAGACTQLPPPVSGKKNAGEVPQNPDVAQSAGTFLSLDDSEIGVMKLTLSGDDAKKIHQLLAIGVESGAGQSGDLVKSGRDFSCKRSGDKSSCEFLIRVPAGTFSIQREEGAIKKASPEAVQVKESDAYISVSDPSEGAKVRLQVLDEYAEKIFQALSVQRTFDLTPDSVNGPGVRKAAAQVDCYQRSKSATPEQKTYDCHLFLDLSLGKMDDVDPSVMQ
jgi:hypothetical protein